MPHLVMLYAGELADLVDVEGLCRSAADALLAVKDEEGRAVFPVGGTRVFAFPAAHAAISDGGAAGKAAGGSGDYSFFYLNLRMGTGRSEGVHRATGDALLSVVRTFMSPYAESHHYGVTVQIDQSEQQVYDAKLSTLHPLFR